MWNDSEWGGYVHEVSPFAAGDDYATSTLVAKVAEFMDLIAVAMHQRPSNFMNQADSIENTIDAMRDAGVRDSVSILIGGAPVTQEYAERIGADGYGRNATVAAQVAKKLAEA